MKRILLLLAVCVVFSQSVLAAPPVAKTQLITSLSTSDATVTLGGSFKNLQIWLDPQTQTDGVSVYIELNNATATVAGATTIKLPGGSGWFSPPGGLQDAISTFHYITSGATTGTMTVLGTK